MTKKSSNQDEITIPESINKPKHKNDDALKVGHPEEKTTIKVEEKKVTANHFKDRSRFAPQSVPVEVPSKGYLYRELSNDPDVQDGIIRLAPMTAEEEKILTTQRFIEQGVALDMILENCIQSDVDPYDLLSSDRLYLLFYLRGMSYDLLYDFNVKCYHCGQSFIQSIQIDKLPIITWTKTTDAEEPVIIDLPLTGATVEAHFMRGNEEKEMMRKANKLKSFDEPDDRITESLIYLIDKVTLADGEVLGPRDKLDFINHLVAGDCDEFRTKMNERECGIQQLDEIYCPRCNQTLKFNVPLGRNFFRRSRRD